jgi:hypothetical protein
MVVTGHDLLGRFIRTLAENGFPEKDFELLAVALTSFPTELHLETEFIKIDDLPLPTTPMKKSLTPAEKKKALLERQKKQMDKDPQFGEGANIGEFLEHAKSTIELVNKTASSSVKKINFSKASNEDQMIANINDLITHLAQNDQGGSHTQTDRQTQTQTQTQKERERIPSHPSLP